ncbi:MAG: hypothetical protein AAGI01_08660, partial [Myxococcota bacterium]
MTMMWGDRFWRTSLRITALAGAVTIGACAPDIPDDGRPPDRERAIIDSANAILPLPNDAALELDGTLTNPSPGAAGSASGEFGAFLDQRRGWLPQTGIEIPFTGELDPTTFEGNITLHKILPDGETFTLEELAIDRFEQREVRDDVSERFVVSIAPAAPLEPATQYGVIVTNSVLSKSDDSQVPGVAITAPLEFFFALGTEAVISPTGEVHVDLLAPGPEATDEEILEAQRTAGLLEGLRQVLRPLTEAMLNDGIDRSKVALAFNWTTTAETFTVLDPATGVIPLPSTLALDADGTFPRAGLDSLVAVDANGGTAPDGIPLAQVFFDEYLATLHGWPNTSLVPIVLPVSGPIDASSLVPGETVQLWELDGAGGGTEITAFSAAFVDDEDGRNIVITPDASVGDLKLNTNYVAFATTGVQSASGSALQPPLTGYMATQPFPVFDGTASTVAAIPDADAEVLEGARQVLRPAAELVESLAGVPYTELAAIAPWFTWRDPFISFDPTTGDIPFPNAVLQGEGGRIQLPTQGLSGAQLAIVNELNSRDGFSALGAGYFSVTGELDPSTITLFQSGQTGDERGSIAVADADASPLPTLLPDGDIIAEYEAQQGRVYLRPANPYKRENLYAAVISNRIRGINGLPVKPSPFMVFISSPQPVYDADTD